MRALWPSHWFRRRNASDPQAHERRLRILTVSMSPGDIFLLEHMACEYSWETTFHHCPQEAFRSAASDSFELILCDRTQFGSSWQEVMEHLAVISPESSILLVSPTWEDDLWLEVLNRGGFDILVRPFQPRTFLCTLESALRCLCYKTESP